MISRVSSPDMIKLAADQSPDDIVVGLPDEVGNLLDDVRRIRYKDVDHPINPNHRVRWRNKWHDASLNEDGDLLLRNSDGTSIELVPRTKDDET